MGSSQVAAERPDAIAPLQHPPIPPRRRGRSIGQLLDAVCPEHIRHKVLEGLCDVTERGAFVRDHRREQRRLGRMRKTTLAADYALGKRSRDVDIAADHPRVEQRVVCAVKNRQVRGGRRLWQQRTGASKVLRLMTHSSRT